MKSIIAASWKKLVDFIRYATGFSDLADTPISGKALYDQYTEERNTKSASRDCCLPVTRHDFETQGVTCPNCLAQAVEPGDWIQVHATTRRDDQGNSYTEESVCCQQCYSFLMASPDSDIDPIGEGEEYDKDEYHRFVRPEGWVPPDVRTEEREPVVGDWVIALVDSADDEFKKYHRAEGRIESITDGIAQCALAGYSGMTVKSFTSIPAKYLKVMFFSSFRENCICIVNRGPHKGKVVKFLGKNDDKINDVAVIEVDPETEQVPDQPIKPFNIPQERLRILHY